MIKSQDTTRLAQSASALGAALLGFGLGSKFGNVIASYALVIIVIGAIFHIWGMYLIQMKKGDDKNTRIAKALWISAWVCLVALIMIIVYLAIKK